MSEVLFKMFLLHFEKSELCQKSLITIVNSNCNKTHGKFVIGRILGGFTKGGGGGRLKTMVCVNILSRFMMNNTSKLGRVTA